MATRKYQSKHIEEVIDQTLIHRKVLAQTPTGGGKTYEFALISQRFVNKHDKSVLILVHREELMYQAARTIKKLTGIEPVLITAESKHYRIGRVYIGMVESTVRRLNLFDNVGLVIIDECHMANFNKIHALFMDETIIGFTATPISSSKKQPLNGFYDCIVVGPQISELIALGYLAQNATRVPKSAVDYSGITIDNRKGDFNENQLATEFKAAKNVANVVRAYQKFCNEEKCIVFNVNLEHSREVEKYLKGCGFNARHLGSDNNHERAEILKWFKETEDAILCNVMIATVGFDEPSCRNIIINFDTLSLAKYIQCCGRGGRIMDEEFMETFQKDYPYQLSSKYTFNIIDLGRNYSRFGDWSWDRNWEYIFTHPGVPGDGVAPTKTCPQCYGVNHAAVRQCTMKMPDGELCMYEFERRKTAKEQDLEEMILITKGISTEELAAKNRFKYKYYTFLELGVEVVNRMFQTFGKLPSENIVNRYFKSYYQLCIDWYAKELANKDGNMEDISNSGWHIRKAQNNFNELIRKRNLEAKTVSESRIYNWNETSSTE